MTPERENAPADSAPLHVGTEWTPPADAEARPAAGGSFARAANMRPDLDATVEITEPMAAEPPGYTASPTWGAGAALPSHGLLSDYSPSPNAPGGPSTVHESYSSGTPPNYNDEIDIPGTFKDFGRIILTPDRYFREQAGRTGLMSPILLVGVYLVLSITTTLIASGAQGVAGFLASLIFSPVSLAVSGARMLALYLVMALAIHFLGRLFGNRQNFSVSVRACVYADAPRFLLSLFGTLAMAFVVMPGMKAHPISTTDIEQTLRMPPGTIEIRSTPGGIPAVPPLRTSRDQNAPSRSGPAASATPRPAPDSLLRLARLFWQRSGAAMAIPVAFALIGWAWSTTLLILAIHRLQQIPAAAAIAVVFLLYTLCILLIGLVVFCFAGMILGLATGGMHGGGVGR